MDDITPRNLEKRISDAHRTADLFRIHECVLATLIYPESGPGAALAKLRRTPNGTRQYGEARLAVVVALNAEILRITDPAQLLMPCPIEVTNAEQSWLLCLATGDLGFPFDLALTVNPANALGG